MNELIDKELAIQTILGEYPDAHYPSWYADIIRKIEPTYEGVVNGDTLIVTLNTDDFYNVGRVVLKGKSGIWCKTMYQDVPDIIKCKDCKFTDGKGPIADGRYWCVLHVGFMDFCSDAERRTDE